MSDHLTLGHFPTSYVQVTMWSVTVLYSACTLTMQCLSQWSPSLSNLRGRFSLEVIIVGIVPRTKLSLFTFMQFQGIKSRSNAMQSRQQGWLCWKDKALSAVKSRSFKQAASESANYAEFSEKLHVSHDREARGLATLCSAVRTLAG